MIAILCEGPAAGTWIDRPYLLDSIAVPFACNGGTCRAIYGLAEQVTKTVRVLKPIGEEHRHTCRKEDHGRS